MVALFGFFAIFMISAVESDGPNRQMIDTYPEHGATITGDRVKKLPLVYADIMYYLQNSLESPYQTFNVNFDCFELDGLVWKNMSNDQIDLLNAFKSTYSVSIKYTDSVTKITNYYGCSGFFINPTQLITAKHCVMDCECYYAVRRCREPFGHKFIRKSVRVAPGRMFNANDEDVSIAVEVTKVSQYSDIALLTVKETSFKSPYFVKLFPFEQIGSNQKIMDDIQIVVIGYPALHQLDDNFIYKTKDDQVITGKQLKSFYGINSVSVKGIGIGNITVYNNAATWSQSSGGLVIVVGQENNAVGVHNGGDTSIPYFTSTKDPFFKDIIDQKQEL